MKLAGVRAILFANQAHLQLLAHLYVHLVLLARFLLLMRQNVTCAKPASLAKSDKVDFVFSAMSGNPVVKLLNRAQYVISRKD